MDWSLVKGIDMSARRIWIITCEICEKTKEFDGSLSVEELGIAAHDIGWELPVYGGMFCTMCTRAVKALATKGVE
jgi:hypothetical protein